MKLNWQKNTFSHRVKLTFDCLGGMDTLLTLPNSYGIFSRPCVQQPGHDWMSFLFLMDTTIDQSIKCQKMKPFAPRKIFFRLSKPMENIQLG